MKLGLQVYTDNTQASMIADWSALAVGTVVETNKHGFGYLSTFIPMTVNDAFRFYDATPTAHIVLGDGAFHAFEGRIEDRPFVNGGLEIGAFGYWRAMYDTPYTATWSASLYKHWFIMNRDDLANTNNKMFVVDTNNRLFIGLRKNEAYTSTDIGRIGFTTPGVDSNPVVRIEFDYEYTGGVNYTCNLISYTTSFGTGAHTEWTLAGDGSTLSGSQDITLANGGDVFVMQFQNAPETNTTHSGDTGAGYLEITNIRVLGTSTANIYADEIIGDIIGQVSALNSGQLSSSTALIDSPTVDLNEEAYRDELPAKILIRLAKRGDNSTPPDLYEVGVWEDQRLYFRVKGSAGQTWYTDIVSLDVDSTIDGMYNSVYAAYPNDRGTKFRTAIASDSASIARYGIVRRKALSTNTSNGTEAGTFADAFLEDNKDITPRATIFVPQLYTASGASVPLYYARANDMITIRNLPVTSGSGVDKIRTFRISRMRYDVDNDLLEVVPELDPPSLEFLVAQNAAALGIV